MKKLVLLSAALLVAGCGENAASDSAIKEAIEEAVDFQSLETRNGLRYQVNESELYSGWAKRMYYLSEQIESLAHFKDGKLDGLMTTWHENGQKMGEGTFKDGKYDGLSTSWHENGQKQAEVIWKDGELVSKKLWNSKGEEVETEEESEK